MKPISTLIFALCTTTAITTANAAATKCVQLNNFSSCGERPNYTDVDWRFTNGCTFNGVTIDIRGIGVLSSSSITSIGATADTLGASGSSCWCKLIYPAVSKWVCTGKTASTQNSCSSTCANLFKSTSDATFRNAIISNLIY